MSIKKKVTSHQMTGRRSEPKLFQCTGFGDCSMVFTRSEHLARHARKHTGEKPFQCISPGCSRMFSRFDNMMQHANTHNRMKKKDVSQKEEEVPALVHQPQIYHSPPSYPPTPSPPKSYQEIHEHSYYPQSICYSPILPPPSTSQSIYSPGMGSLPIHHATPTHSYYTQPSPYAHDSNEYCTLSMQDPSNVYSNHTRHQLPSPVNTVFEMNEPMIKIEGVEITQDEYEAIEGFSRLMSAPIVHQTRRSSSSAILSRNSNLNFFRQQVAISQESFQRSSYL